MFEAPRRSRYGLRWALVLIGLAAPAAAQRPGPAEIEVHGYGTSQFADTDGNHYQAGDSDGSYDSTHFALGVVADWDQLRIATQVQWETGHSFDGTKTQVDYAFAEWSFSDQARLRLGQAKHPFGIYAETLDVGTVRPFLSLPIGVYGPTGVVAEHYTGVGLTGIFASSSSWELSYDVYAGEVVLDAAHPWEALEKIGFREDERLRVTDLLGGRVVIQAPASGLSFGGSLYGGSAAPDRAAGEEGRAEAEHSKHGEVDAELRPGEHDGGHHEAAISGGHFTFGLQAEYLGDALLARTELVRHRFDDRHDIDALYLELGYRLTPHWQLAGRYDWAEVELAEQRAAAEVTHMAESLLEHEDLSFGLNYWFSDDLVVKLSHHTVDGNFFARPVRTGVRTVVGAQALESSTRLVLLGVSFSF